MSDAINPAAPHFLPPFIVGPGETDFLLTGAVIFLIVLVLILGSTYFWLHSIPERISHGSHKIQFQLVAVLSLLALFTHNNAFWIGALLLALVPIPDFWTPLATMADSLAKMAGRRLRDAGADDRPVAAHVSVAASSPPQGAAAPRHADSGVLSPATGETSGGPPVPGNEESALAAKAGGPERPGLTKEGA